MVIMTNTNVIISKTSTYLQSLPEYDKLRNLIYPSIAIYTTPETHSLYVIMHVYIYMYKYQNLYMHIYKLYTECAYAQCGIARYIVTVCYSCRLSTIARNVDGLLIKLPPRTCTGKRNRLPLSHCKLGTCQDLSNNLLLVFRTGYRCHQAHHWLTFPNCDVPGSVQPNNLLLQLPALLLL